MGIIARVIAGVIALVLGIWGNYLVSPAWGFRSTEMWWFLLIMGIITVVIFGIVEWFLYEEEDEIPICSIVSGVATVVIIIVMVVGGLTGAKSFNAAKYRDLIEIEEADFERDIPKATEDSEFFIVDLETARKLGDRTVGSIENISWYDVDDEYNLIKYQGKYYRISELNYGDIFKYNKAKNSGIPGYVLVNAVNQEAEFVQLEDPIYYSPSAHFGKKLDRHLRGQYPTYMFGTSFFEIDEDGNPYYVTAVKKPTIGLFSGKVEESFVITNAYSGESKEYVVDELPEWVDHAFDLSYLMRVTDYNQKYVHGWVNSWKTKTDVKKTTYTYGGGYYNTAITADGDVVFYTGVTPANNAETNIGFVLANPRTGEVSYYYCPGAEETSAMSAAEGLVQNLGYVSTFPTILNVDGEETYFMLLKDNAGLVQRYALCNIKNYAKVVEAETFEKALNLYKEKIGTKTPEELEKEEKLEASGAIKNLYQAQIDGCTFYYFTLEGSNNLYMSSIKNSNKQVLLKEGTQVTIQYIEASEDGVFLVQKIQF